jgi:hypothetical protein
MRIRFAPIGLVLLAASLVVAFHEIQIRAFWSGFEDPDPPLFYRLDWLWAALVILAPGLLIGLSVRRNAAWLGGFAYLLGSISSFAYHDGERLVPHQFLPSLKYWPYLLRSFLIVALTGMVVAMIGGWLRRRLTFVRTDTQARLR